MSVEALGGRAYTDIQGLGELKRLARENDPAAMRETARQFETVFAKMMLQSMREASMGDEIFDTQESQMYRGMFDDQLALELTRGKGLGVAEMMVQQLMRSDLAAQAAAAGTDLKTTLAPLPPRVSVGGSAGMSIGAAAAADSTPAPEAVPTAATRRAFLESIRPAAEKAAAELGVSPRAILAQAALESGWGRAMPTDGQGRSSLNLFGIKASGRWDGPSVASQTTEYVGGRPLRSLDHFRAYDSVEASVADHTRLLARSPRYAAALNVGEDIGAYANALQRGGYATDPRYAQKLQAVAESVDRLLGAAAPATVAPAQG